VRAAALQSTDDIRAFQKTVSRSLFGRHLYGCFRRCALSVEGVLQLSMVGRALPEGGDKEQEAALGKHKEALTTPHTTPSGLLRRARNFARTWYEKFGRQTDY
jgi:hypothetical protein